MANFRRVARRKAVKYGINPDLFESQIEAESNFDPDVIYGRRVSSAGAQGIAQIMPATARGWGVNPLKPRKALDAAAKNMANYAKQLGSYEEALRAYNAGPGAVQASYGYGETNAYVGRIFDDAGVPRSADGLIDPGQRFDNTGGGNGGGGGGGGSRTKLRVKRTEVPGVDNSALRQQLKVQYLLDRDNDPNALMKLGLGLQQAADVPSTKRTRLVATKRGRGAETLPNGTQSRDGGRRRPRGRQIGEPGELRELFYNGPGGANVDEGRRVGHGFVDGHTDHVHAAGATRKQTMQMARVAQRMGLTVREFAPFDPVDPGVHTSGSFHSQPSGAIDVSGDPEAMKRFSRYVARVMYGVPKP